MRPPYRSLLFAEPLMDYAAIKAEQGPGQNPDAWENGQLPLVPNKDKALEKEVILPKEYANLVQGTSLEGTVLLDGRNAHWQRAPDGAVRIDHVSAPGIIHMELLGGSPNGISIHEIYEDGNHPNKSYESARRYDATGSLKEITTRLRSSQDSLRQEFDKGHVLRLQTSTSSSETDAAGQATAAMREMDVSYDPQGQVLRASGHAVDKNAASTRDRQITVNGNVTYYSDVQTEEIQLKENALQQKTTTTEKSWNEGQLVSLHINSSESIYDENRTRTNNVVRDEKWMFDVDGEVASFTADTTNDGLDERREIRIQKTRMDKDLFHRVAVKTEYQDGKIFNSYSWDVTEDGRRNPLTGTIEVMNENGRHDAYHVKDGKWQDIHENPADPLPPPFTIDEKTIPLPTKFNDHNPISSAKSVSPRGHGLNSFSPVGV